MLSQDTSRNFLHSSNPATKYKLFMKGTHLEQIAYDYARTEEQQQLMKEEIKRKKEMLGVLERKAKELEEEVNSIDQLARAEEKVRKLNHELLWSVVGKLRATVMKEEEVLVASRQKVQKDEERVAKGEEKLAGRKQVLDGARRQLEEAVKEAGVVETRQNQQQSEKRSHEKAVREAKVCVS